MEYYTIQYVIEKNRQDNMKYNSNNQTNVRKKLELVCFFIFYCK